MFDFQQMLGTPQAREMMFQMMAQQMGQAPPQVREALSRVTVTVKKRPRGFELNIGECHDEQVESVIRAALDSWSDMLTRGFQAMGYKVRIYE
jgi:hypothetical protein